MMKTNLTLVINGEAREVVAVRMDETYTEKVYYAWEVVGQDANGEDIVKERKLAKPELVEYPVYAIATGYDLTDAMCVANHALPLRELTDADFDGIYEADDDDDSVYADYAYVIRG